MEKKRINGQMFAFDSVKVGTFEVPIVGMISDQFPDFVQYDSQRPFHLNPSNGSIIVLTEIEEFFDNMRLVYKYIDTNGLSSSNIINALLSLCNNHIKSKGRIIDNDLINYIEQAIIATYVLFDKIHQVEITTEIREKLWVDLKEMTFKQLKNYIYITKYDTKNPLEPKPYLVKLTDTLFDETIPAEQDYKYVKLNGKRLALLFMALSKGLFNRPRKGQIYYEDHNDGSCTLYFKRDYYATLTDSIFRAYSQGKFAQSNAESDWTDLKNAIDGAKTNERIGVENLKLYGLYDE